MKMVFCLRINYKMGWFFNNPQYKRIHFSEWYSLKSIKKYSIDDDSEYYKTTLYRFLERMMKYEN